MRVDSHQHFIRYVPEDYYWITDTMVPLKRDYLPDELYREMARAGIDGSIAVQARHDRGETEWLLGIAGAERRVLGVVGWLDVSSASFERDLEVLAQNPNLCGLRHMVQDEEDEGFLRRPEFVNGLRLLDHYNLTYDILVWPTQLHSAMELARMLPSQWFVLDHLGTPNVRGKEIDAWAEGLRRIARLQNVWCKVSGIVTEADWHTWRDEDFRPYLDIALDAFSPSRLMIGSDWPVCLLAGEYPRVLRIVQDYVSMLSPSEQDAILGENARRFYLARRRGLLG